MMTEFWNMPTTPRLDIEDVFTKDAIKTIAEDLCVDPDDLERLDLCKDLYRFLFWMSPWVMENIYIDDSYLEVATLEKDGETAYWRQMFNHGQLDEARENNDLLRSRVPYISIFILAGYYRNLVGDEDPFLPSVWTRLPDLVKRPILKDEAGYPEGLPDEAYANEDYANLEDL